MALSRIPALLSLAAALLLLAHALDRLDGVGLVDLAHALDHLDGVSLIDLATRRNMILLCHAILLLLLGDSGLLSTPARRRHQTAEATCYYSAPERSRHARSAAVVWRRDRSPAASNAAEAVEDPCAARPLTEPECDELVPDHVSTKEIVLVEEQRGTYYFDDAHLVAAAGELHPPVAMDGRTISPMDFDRAVVVADQERNGPEEEEVAGEVETQLPEELGEEEEEEEDLDEMNRRFEAFIAATKEKMRLEALQPAHVSSSENRRMLLA